ncbi:type VII secretion-associated serine protease mycosin [Streptomyces sp. NPDC001941]|uniref:type VII secretion-associated serine protease mycosin n=1 Tax=Streptomyces sp. NPDC001941 TaxID=3154659 RepID=UPI0033276817
MRTSRIVTTALGMLLVGVAAGPAHADSVRSQQWYLTAMGAEEIWQISKGVGVTVAVIDSGVDASGADLQGQVLQGKDLAPARPGDERTDYDGHGTSMAAIIAGTGKSGGGDGAFGLAPGAKILPVRMPNGLDAKNLKDDARQFNVAAPEAIRFAADAGARVINISLAVREGSQQLTDAVTYALGKGALVFAGVGNNGEKGNAPQFPAATPGVVGVGAVDKNLKRTKESQYGPQVDVVAPGDKMVHACAAKSGLCESAGTSDATALASATAALIWSKHPDWTNNQVLKVMLNTASGSTTGEKRSDFIGYGALRPLRALTTPGDPGPADQRPIPDLEQAGGSSSAPSSPATAPAPRASGAAETASDADSGSNSGLYIGIGVAAALLVGGGVAFAVVRGRRSV